MLHLPSLPSTSSSGPTIASLLSSPNSSALNNQVNMDILDDQGDSQSPPPPPPPQEIETETTSVKAYGCGVTGCEVSYSNPNGLYYHMKAAHPTNTSGKPFRCALAGCSKKYKNINGLQYHISNAKGSSGHKYDTEEGANDINNKPFKCPVAGCKSNYVSANGLQYHQKKVHENTDGYRKANPQNSQVNQRSDDSDSQTSPNAEIDGSITHDWVPNDSNNQQLPVFAFPKAFPNRFNEQLLSFSDSPHFTCKQDGCGKMFNSAVDLSNHTRDDHSINTRAANNTRQRRKPVSN
jgi:hypothetical protein